MPTILHLDRSQFSRNIVQNIANQKKFFYVGSQTAGEAFELLRNQEINLIITDKDVASPPLEVFLKDLNQSEFNGIPVIVIAEDNSAKTQKKFFSLGISNYLPRGDATAEYLSCYLDQFLEQESLEGELQDITCSILNESQASIGRITSELRSWGFTKVDSFEDPATLLMKKKSYSVYFVGLMKPQVAGENLVRELKRRHPNCIIIITSDIKDIQFAGGLLKVGANDYISTFFEEELSRDRFMAHIRTFRLLQLQRRENSTLQRLASIDGLTGIYNRRHILQSLKGELEKAARYHRSLTILLLDVDHFKEINDRYGHLIGDSVLRQFAKVIKGHCLDVDALGRYGGEEFLLLMPETDEKNGCILAERIRTAIADHAFPYITGRITVSGGLVEFQGEQSGELIKEADRRLYMAKTQGRNRIQGFSETVARKIQEPVPSVFPT